MYIPVKNPNNCKNLGTHKKLYYNLHVYPIENSVICKVQVLKDHQELSTTCESTVICSCGYNVFELESNTWLVLISEPFQVTLNCPGANADNYPLEEPYL